jgi:hypothetical protein
MSTSSNKSKIIKTFRPGQRRKADEEAIAALMRTGLTGREAES